jgi:uncharacterized protein YhjY with autotransporter beta-barrel domain
LFIRSLRMIWPVAAVMGLYVLSSAPASSQTTAPGAPAITLDPLQEAIDAAVTATCKGLKALTLAKLNPAQGDLFDQCHGIVNAPLGSTLGALQQVSGNEYSSQGALATRVVSGQFANISGRLSVLRLGAYAAPGQLISFNNPAGSSSQGDDFAPGIGLAGQGPQGAIVNTAFVDSGYAPVAGNDGSAGGGGGGVTGAVQNPWGVYVQGSYNSGHHDATANEDPFHFHAASVTAGLDYNFGHAVLGVSAGYDDYDAGFGALGTAVSGGSAQVKDTSGSIYGAWFDQGWNFNGIATWGRLQTNLSRVVSYTLTYANTTPNPFGTAECVGATCTVSTSRTLNGDPNGSSVAIGATGGYQTRAGAFDIAPNLSVNYRRASINSFVENDPNPPAGGDGLALAFGDQVVESFRTILGVDLSTPISASFGVITPLMRLEWDHEFKTGVRYLQAQYAAAGGLLNANGGCLSCFALPTDTVGANYGLVGAGLSVLLAHRVQAFVYDEVLFGVSNYSSNSVAIGLRGQF